MVLPSQPTTTASHPQTATSQTTSRRLDYDIVIGGGSIVGLTVACGLKNLGWKIAIIEPKPQSATAANGQAYAITLLSGKIWQSLGVWQEILPRINTFREIRLSDGDYPRFVSFYPEDIGMEAGDRLGYVAEHRVLIEALQNSLNQADNVTWLCPAAVEQATYHSDRVEVAVAAEGSRYTINARLLVAADGSQSPLRRAANIPTHGWKYWQSCVVATIKPEFPNPHIAYERFRRNGPFAILPVARDRCRIVWTAPHQEAQRIASLNDEQFLAEIALQFGNHMGRLQVEGKRMLFPVQLMHSDRYAGHRLALVGNAAHACHPVGGQGLNLGIRDAAALAQVLQTAAQNGEDIGDISVLQRYERWRKQENWLILGMTDLLNRVFSNQWLPLVATRRLVLEAMRQLQPLKSLSLRMMTGLSGRPPLSVRELLHF
ncbi:FAD-dependent hydroxylase [Geitlerinema sp. PCC 9228]|jgi:2-octaprenyl-6-methoxyphenol hydroxylase|uniref:FAD-dependent hydroxylase n=1 Tax=Geitlerinema sp. PCC 9228 TaxID=111611 RepID=UPI0008F9D07D|nr:FAD-dependent hydroxylase [Geitlerinema sp. PCC 9228]